jgi:hypothetical protein
MSELSGTAWKILCLIIRKTIGFQNKSGDFIDYGQISDFTGISSPNAISDAIRELEGFRDVKAKGQKKKIWHRSDSAPVLIIVERGARQYGTGHVETTYYRLNPDAKIKPSMKIIDSEKAVYDFHRDNKQSSFNNSERSNLTAKSDSNSKLISLRLGECDSDPFDFSDDDFDDLEPLAHE